MPATLHAHNTLFGQAPRTIWKGGSEIEAEYEWEIFKRFYEEDKPAANPRDDQVMVHHFTVAWTYGLHRDWAIRLSLPTLLATHTSKDHTESRFGLGNIPFSVKWRFYNDPFKGGSVQAGTWVRIWFPTADKSEDGKLLGEDIEFGNETWKFQWGLTASYSTRQYYFWFDVAAHASTRRSGTGSGPGLIVHPAFAWRAFELTDYKDFDLILLIESDFAIEERGHVNHNQNENSGYIKTHLELGVQMNITNRVEIKFGYHIPLYRRFYGRQFVHEGEFKFSFNYLI
ncbi:MAG: hypothetical protein KDB82_06865 [Planctomycetes bacterium]|nr:hypothetical protein [Planctomycetota bacterium]